MTFKRQLISINKSPRRIKRDAGGRKKNPIAQILRSPLYKPKVKPSGKTYSRKNNTKKPLTE